MCPGYTVSWSENNMSLNWSPIVAVFLGVGQTPWFIIMAVPSADCHNLGFEKSAIFRPWYFSYFIYHYNIDYAIPRKSIDVSVLFQTMPKNHCPHEKVAIFRPKKTPTLFVLPGIHPGSAQTSGLGVQVPQCPEKCWASEIFGEALMPLIW